MNSPILSEDSTLSSIQDFPLASPIASSELTYFSRSPSPPPSYRLATPPLSQDAGEDMPRPRKRRKTEPKIRTTQHLDLTSVTAQSEYDRQESIETLIRALRNRRKIVVVAGAGISVSAGIPDFRSSHGLFRTLRGEHKLKGSGKQLFDASVYKDDSSTSHFHDMVRQLSSMSADAKPTLFHRFLARLSSEGRLLRLYTQNVDGLETELPPLETKVPLPHKGPWPTTIQLHGGLETMTCQKCRQISKFDATLFDGPVPPPCPQCVEADDARTNLAGKRSHGIGRLRPRIVLYNEHNPDDEAIGAVTTADMRTRPDAVVVVGTSMKIPGVRRIVSQMCRIVRGRREGTTIWINRDGIPAGKDLEDCWDLIVKGDSDEVAKLASLREWDDPTPAEEYTDNELERVKTAQGELKVIVPPSPEKKSVAMFAIGKTTTSVLTPPRSHDGDPDAGAEVKDRPVTPRIVLRMDRATEEDRKMGQVFKGENQPKKRLAGRPPKTSQIPTTKRKYTKKPKDVGSNQSRLNAKVSKAKPVAVRVLSPSKKQPLSALRQSALNSEQSLTGLAPCLAGPTSEPPHTPSAVGSPGSSREDMIITPTGNVPRDMVKLLN